MHAMRLPAWFMNLVRARDVVLSTKEEGKARTQDMSHPNNSADRTACNEKVVAAPRAPVSETCTHRARLLFHGSEAHGSVRTRQAGAAERLPVNAGLQRSVDETFELAMSSCQNPWQGWASERPDDRRTARKSAFSGQVQYPGEEAVQTATYTIFFNTLRVNRCQKPKGRAIMFSNRKRNCTLLRDAL